MNNLDMMRKRLEWQGGIHQEDRMIKDKWRTLQKTLLYSYQACTVQLAQKFDQVLYEGPDAGMGFDPPVRALINPDKVKQDYDDKILSIDYEHGFEPGDVFEWKKTDTHWIIYTQEITEDAYFRGEIRRCRYRIKFKDSNGQECYTWAAIRGPVETQINSIQKNQIRLDQPNLSLNILLPRNKKTEYAFDRYKEFLLEGKCWRVEAPDIISMKNVIEVNAEEYYIDRDTDDVIKELKNGLVIEPVDPTPNSEIIGETFIKPKIAEVYTSPEPGGKWCIEEKDFPVTITGKSNDSVEITWNKMVSGQFTLRWSKGDKIVTKTIVVESLF